MPQRGLGAGGGAPGPTYHTTDMNTLAHWKLDADLTDDSGNEGDLTNTSYRSSPFTGFDADCQRVNAADKTQLGSLAASPIKTSGAITCALWLYPTAHPASNSALVGFRGGGSSGSPDTFNFPWEIQWMSSGHLKFFWQYDLKQPAETGTWALPLNQWVHVMGTRNSAGTAAELYINGIEEASTSGETQHNGGSNQNKFLIANNDLTSEGEGFVASVWITGSHYNASQALTLYQSAVV